MSRNFDTAVKIVLQHEVGNDATGGYTDDPVDRGGATKWGITQRTLAAYLSGDPQVQVSPDVKDLTMVQALDIYRSEYWDDIGLEQISSPELAVVMMDQGVLTGPGSVIGRLQGLLGLKVDGILGPQTIAAANRGEGDDLAFKLIRASVHHYVGIVEHDASQLKFLGGWLERLMSLVDFIIFGAR